MHDSLPVSPPRLPLILVVATVVTVALYVLFFDRVFYFMRVMATPENNYGYLLVGLGLFVLWRRLPMLLRCQNGPSWAGVGIVLAGLALMLVSEFGFLMRLTYAAFFVVAAGLIVTVLGRGVIRLLIAPFAAFALAMPVPGYATVQLSTTLQQVSSRLGAEMLRWLDIAVYQGGNIIDLGIYQLQVAEACSGLRYLIPLLLTALCLVWLARAPWWSKLFTVLLVVPLTVVLNSFRIAMTGMLVEHRGIAAAEGFMHFFEGWLVFLIAIALLVALLVTTTRLARGGGQLGEILDFDRIEGVGLGRDGAAMARRAPPLASAPPLAAALAIVAFAAFGQPLAARESTAPERPPLAMFPLAVGEHLGTPREVGPDIVAALESSDQLLVDYAAPGAPAPVNLWVAYYASQTDGAAIHSPKECLPAGGWEYERLTRREIDVRGADPDRPFRINEAVAVDGNERLVMVFWVEARGRQLASEFRNKLYNLRDTLVLGRSDGALVRLTTPVGPAETDAAALVRLYAFLDEAYVHLQPHVDRYNDGDNR